MLKKTITYTDFDGNERTEDFYFNLTKAELAKMQSSVNGGLDKLIKRIVDAQDQPTIMATLEDIIRRAYGEKSLDGKTFKKSEEIYKNFEATEAYSELFMEVCSDAKKAAAFIEGIVPKVENPQESK
jgi:hypothetical protein